MPYCQKCGAAMEDDAVFCTQCGTRNEQPNSFPRAGYGRSNTRSGSSGSGLAVLGLILGIVGFILTIVALGEIVDVGRISVLRRDEDFLTVVFLSLVLNAAAFGLGNYVKKRDPKNGLAAGSAAVGIGGFVCLVVSLLILFL